MMRLPYLHDDINRAFLIILAFPAITIALVELMSDSTYDTNFYDFPIECKPYLWQHLFWILDIQKCTF